MTNNQQILFINSLFHSKQKKPIFVRVTEKTGVKYLIECVGGSIIVFRFHFGDGTKGLWDSWSDLEEIKNTFRMYSL